MKTIDLHNIDNFLSIFDAKRLTVRPTGRKLAIRMSGNRVSPRGAFFPQLFSIVRLGLLARIFNLMFDIPTFQRP